MDVKSSQEYENMDRTEVWDARHRKWMEAPDLENLKTKDIWFENRFHNILPPTLIPKPGHFLASGGGAGFYPPALARRYKYYTGIDTSRAAIDFATDHFRGDGRVFLRVGHRTGSTRFMADQSYDLIFSCTVLQHFTIE